MTTNAVHAIKRTAKRDFPYLNLTRPNRATHTRSQKNDATYQTCPISFLNMKCLGLSEELGVFWPRMYRFILLVESNADVAVMNGLFFQIFMSIVFYIFYFFRVFYLSIN